jgi:hypothetical protein
MWTEFVVIALGMQPIKDAENGMTILKWILGSRL